MLRIQRQEASDCFSSSNILFLQVRNLAQANCPLVLRFLLVEQRQLSRVPGKLQAVLTECGFSCVFVQLFHLVIYKLKAGLDLWLFGRDILNPELKLVSTEIGVFERQRFGELIVVVPQVCNYLVNNVKKISF